MAKLEHFGRDMEQLELILCQWKCKMANHFGNSLATSFKGNHTCTPWPCNSIPSYSLKRNKNSSSQKKHMNKNICRSFIHSRKTWKWLKRLSAGEWINRLWLIHTVEPYSAVKGFAQWRHSTWMSFETHQAGWKKPVSKKYILCNSIHMKCHNRQKQSMVEKTTTAVVCGGRLTGQRAQGDFWEIGNGLHLGLLWVP